MVQHLRGSQFIFTYGPGSILESPDGPRIIPLPEIGLFESNSSIRPNDFEISDSRMSHGLLDGARIFRLPSNAELRRDESIAIYRTKPFPSWKLCQNFNSHTFSVLYRGYSCPVCRSGTRQEAIRFIMACPAGHLDDVNWPFLVHSNQAQCNQNRWFKWEGEGASLGKIDITCDRCGSTVNLGRVYGQDWYCSSRYPENEMLGAPPNRPGVCTQRARIIQRQASNLRIPELRILFSITDRYTPTELHNLLQLSPLYHTFIGTGVPTSINHLEGILKNLESRNLIKSSQVNKILNYNWVEIQRTINEILNSSQPTSYHDLLLEEFRGLIKASINGAPPVRGPTPSSPVIFEVRPQDIYDFPTPNGRTLKIVPITKLRTVIVQIGYRREVGQIGNTSQPVRLISTGMADPIDPSQKWYPGTEHYGEGLFIRFAENEGIHLPLEEKNAQNWLNSFNNPTKYENTEFAFRIENRFDELHPVFVWWHTFAHLLIRAISIEAGYPAPSIRERIYMSKESDGVRGGIVLYATQPGSTGTFGGLISLVPHFGGILDTTFDMLKICSSDPLCKENEFIDGKYSGASCYACTLLSETSCEHRNLWLDRNVLVDNLP